MTNPKKSPAKSKPGNNPAAPKTPPALVYPSPLLGIPRAETPSRQIEIVLSGRTDEIYGAGLKAKDQAQKDASARVTPLHTEHMKNLGHIGLVFNNEMTDARTCYEADLRAAQSRRDRSEATARTNRTSHTDDENARHTDALKPIESGLKRQLFIIDNSIKSELSAIGNEFTEYHAAHREREIVEMERRRAAKEREDKARAEREAAQKAASEAAAAAQTADVAETAKEIAAKSLGVSPSDVQVIPGTPGMPTTVAVRRRPGAAMGALLAVAALAGESLDEIEAVGRAGRAGASKISTEG